LPGYWFALGACVLLGLWWMPEAKYVTERFLAGATFTSALHYVSFFPSELDPTLWSISLEVLCYVLLPILILPAWRLIRDRDPKRLLRYLIWVLAGLQLAHFLILGFFMTDLHDKGWQYGMIGGAKEWLPYWNPASFMTQFMLGSCAALAIAWRQRQSTPIVAEEFDLLGARALLAAFLVCALLGHMGTPNFITRQPYVTPLFPALCALALYAMHFGTKLPAVLDNRLARFIATISFGLYLWHWPVIEAFHFWWAPGTKYFSLTSGWKWLLLCVLVLAISVILASLSWYLLERPVLRWAHRRQAFKSVADRQAVSWPVPGS
jgi:peptidoglycan/LPS O-acetylase OafA/YrhL